MIQRTLLEWETLPHGPDPANGATIPADCADRLAKVAAASPLAGRGGGGVLEERRTCLRARGVVGIVVADGCTLEVLPKIDVPSTDPAVRTATIRRRLVHMLAVALDLPLEAGSMTALDWQRDTLLEIVIRLFSEQLAEAVRRGLPRRYVAHEDDLPVLRGALDTTRQFTRLAGNPSRLACRFDLLSEDIPINRIMKAATNLLLRLSRRADTQRRLRDLAMVYDEVSLVQPSALRWDAVVVDRTNSRWRHLLSFARLLLERRFQTTTAGASPGFSLLFEMNELFEAYIGRLVVRAYAGTPLDVVLQGGRLYCLTESISRRGAFQTRPDILIRRNGMITQVIDTKWKRISARIDDPRQGVSQTDIYQMLAYGHVYQAARLTLLYPHTLALGHCEGVQKSYQVAGQDVVLQTASFDVGDGTGATERLRQMLEPTRPAEKFWGFV